MGNLFEIHFFSFVIKRSNSEEKAYQTIHKLACMQDKYANWLLQTQFLNVWELPKNNTFKGLNVFILCKLKAWPEKFLLPILFLTL